MKVYVDPVPKLSPAMDRVAKALKRSAPPSVEITTNLKEADFQVLHAISNRVLRWLRAPSYAVIQYCYRTAATGVLSDEDRDREFQHIWDGKVVWSYYDLAASMSASSTLYYAPLGIDPVFHSSLNGTGRDIGVITSGHVAGPGAEAIEEIAQAAFRVGLTTQHIGPGKVSRMSSVPRGWSAVSGISDHSLSELYSRSRWVSGLRHVEGFELPAVEGLACGARPILFDRPEMRKWYDGHAVFVPECSGSELVNALVKVMENPPDPVSEEERQVVLEKFNWQTITEGFWEKVTA